MDAYEIAEEVVERMAVGQTVGANAVHLTKTEESYVTVEGSSYNYETGRRTVPRMTSCELAEFVFFPERKRINDALAVLEGQLRHCRRGGRS
jgi:hypothetical protein